MNRMSGLFSKAALHIDVYVYVSLRLSRSRRVPFRDCIAHTLKVERGMVNLRP